MPNRVPGASVRSSAVGRLAGGNACSNPSRLGAAAEPAGMPARPVAQSPASVSTAMSSPASATFPVTAASWPS
ncbi:MAG: hypothetical protein E6G84_10155 [Alphaproteobacteria bacterium]|nr:MAG: hypothetical protein E6G84_10155 [Alphaproteobacteria bacterium]